MSVDRFKFISPGIFVNEIDNTGRSTRVGDMGPALIGRSEMGPILEPTVIGDFADFVNMFGLPMPGGNGTDVSRDGNYTSPTYAAYAAQAWLRNNSPVTYIRLGGKAHSEASQTTGLAGWNTSQVTPTQNPTTNGGAYGLFVTDPPTKEIGSASINLVPNDTALDLDAPVTNAFSVNAGVPDSVTIKLNGHTMTVTCSLSQSIIPQLLSLIHISEPTRPY